MKNKNLIFPVIGLIGILVFKFIIEPLEIKTTTDEFINESYLYVLTSKPNENEGDKGTYKYECLDLVKNSHWYQKRVNTTISSRELYHAAIVGDTIQKDKGLSFILLKRTNLILKIPVNYDFNKVVDTVLVR